MPGEQQGAEELNAITEFGDDYGTGEEGSAGSAEGGQSNEIQGEEGGQENIQEVNYEEEAAKKGWRPLEEFDGDPDEWIGAEEFVKREPLYKRLKGQSREIKELRQSIDAMARHFKKTVEGQVQNRLAELQAQRRNAIELGDVESVEQLDGMIETEKKSAPQEDFNPDVPEPAKRWIDKNREWFESNEEMRDFAVTHNTQMLKKYPLEEALAKTQQAVEKAYPEYFKKPEPQPEPENQRKSTPATVEGSVPKGGEGKNYDISRLSKDQKLVYNQIVKGAGTVSHDEFFRDLEAIGELGD